MRFWFSGPQFDSGWNHFFSSAPSFCPSFPLTPPLFLFKCPLILFLLIHHSSVHKMRLSFPLLFFTSTIKMSEIRILWGLHFLTRSCTSAPTCLFKNPSALWTESIREHTEGPSSSFLLDKTIFDFVNVWKWNLSMQGASPRSSDLSGQLGYF